MKALGLTDAKGVATLGTDDVGGPNANEISELRRTAKWHDPLEEVREEDDLLTGEEFKLFQSVTARFNFLAMDGPLFVLGKRIDAKNGFSTHTRLHCPQESCTIHNHIPTNDLQIFVERVTLRCLVMQTLLVATPQENPQWEVLRFGVANS